MTAYVDLLVFEAVASRFVQLILLAVQCVLGGTAAVFYAFHLGDLSAAQAASVAAGLPVLALLPAGFVGVPVLVHYRRGTGRPDVLWSLPVPRVAAVAATLTAFAVGALPGAAAVLGVAVWRYGADLTVRPVAVAVALFGALAVVSLGYFAAQALSERATSVLGAAVILGVALVTPVVAPPDRQPGWLAPLDAVLPFRHLGVLFRAALAGEEPGVTVSVLTVAAWTLAAWAGTAVVLRRRLRSHR